MKKSIFKSLVAVCLLSIAFYSCDNQTEDLQEEEALQEINTTPTEEAVLPTEVSQISEIVATIQKDGHEYRFVAIGNNDDMVVIEKLYGDAEKSNEASTITQDKTPFDIFVSITKQGLEVPERIAITAKGTALQDSGRKIQAVEKTIEIKDPNFSTNNTQKACYDVGYTNFRNSYCGGTPVVSSPTDIRFCDNGTWTSLTRSSYYGGSWRELDDTYTWTNVICGLTTVQFYAWKSSGIWPFNSWSWQLEYQVEFTNGIWYANHYTSNNTERQVRRRASGGSFRAYTRFR